MAVIPEAAVEAAARAAWEQDHDGPWAEAAGGWKLPYLRDARLALEAAAPHMLADAIRTIAADTRTRGDVGKEERGGIEAWVYLEWKAQQALDGALQ